MRIAIIGSGIAGLTTAYLLRNHDCELFEAKPFLALAGHGLELNNGSLIDIPLRVIHPHYYPKLLSLCKELKVDLRKLEHSGSFKLAKDSERFEYSSIPLLNKRYNFVKPNWNNVKLGSLFMYFYHLCQKHKSNKDYDFISFSEFLVKYRISKRLSNTILYPLLSSICTCSYAELDRFPARVLLEMMATIAGPIPMERFYAGTHDIENALIKHLSKVHLSSKVQKVIISDTGGEIHLNGEIRHFDHIVMATEAHLVKNLLEKNKHTMGVLSELNTIPYKQTDTVVHTVDSTHELIKAEKSLHYEEHPVGGQAQASMWLNKVEPHLNLKEQTMQTWNPYDCFVDNELKRSTLNRALITVESYQAVKRLQSFVHPSFSLSGSYLAKGVPLLEGGVESAYRICDYLKSRSKV